MLLRDLPLVILLLMLLLVIFGWFACDIELVDHLSLPVNPNLAKLTYCILANTNFDMMQALEIQMSPIVGQQ